MSDAPRNPETHENENPPEGNGGGWRQPSKPGGWRTPEKPVTQQAEWREAEPVTTSERGSWRVPTLPRDLDVKPEISGAWHLPKPSDTTISKEDESLIPHDDHEPIIPIGDDDQAADVAEVAPVIEVLPFDEHAAEEEAAADDTLDYMDEDEDDESFSMSELIALASLADNASTPEAVDEDADAEVAAADVGLDPGAYAREQLERLRSAQALEQGGTERLESTGSLEPVDAAQDPAAYAREQLAKLGGAAGTEAQQPFTQSVAPATPSLTAEETALTGRFREAETQIRALREQYHNKLITLEQLQNELRRYMVLDEQQQWWMMGIESDAWYRYDNNQWVLDTPAVYVKAQQLASGTAGSSQNIGLPQLTNPLAAQHARDIPLDEGSLVATTPITDDLPLPQQVPVRDPEATIPGTQGVYLGGDATVPYDPSNAATVAMNTVPSAAYQSYESVQSPVADAPPDYNIGTATPTFEKAVEQQRAKTIRTAGIVVALGAAAVFLFAACGIISGVLYYRNLADPWQTQIAALANYQPDAQTARIFAADGSLIAELTSRSSGARDLIALEDVSPELIHAIVSTENERFYDDPGFDPIAIGRAFLQNLTAGEVESGASTITQQIARNLILRDTTVSPQRKLQEIVIAAEIAQQYDKNFILELYLNEVFFGNQSYGIEAASQFYFDHSAADLNLAESAMLAGLIQAPATYDPVIRRDDAFRRMRDVMNIMANVGCLRFQHAPYQGQEFCVTRNDITGGTVAVQMARIESSNYLPRTFQVRYPHFVNYIQAQVEQLFGSSDEIFRQGMQIHTTLQPGIQQNAEAALAAQVRILANNAVNTGAVMVTDPRTGAILAMVGSPDFSNDAIDGQVNNVFTWQQPGSTIKPITYTAALEGVTRANGAIEYLTPSSIIWDVPTTFNTIPAYSPTNYDNQFHGPQAVRFALQNSYNIPAVKAFEFIGVDRFREVATAMGLRFLPESQIGLASALGATDVRLYDMMQAYGTLANNGMQNTLFSIREIRNSSNQAIPLPQRAAPTQSIRADVSFLMNNILSDNEARAAAFGLNSNLSLPELPGRIGAKTGTSDNNRDLWTMGYSNNIVVGVWMGRHDNNPTLNTTQTAAIPVWNAVIRAALQNNTPSGWTNPGGVAQGQVCADDGTLYAQGQRCTNVRNEVFLQAQPPPQADQGWVRTIAIDAWTRLRANETCPNNVISGQFVVINDPTAIAWLSNTPQGQAYARSIGLPVPVQAPPEEECNPGQQQPTINFASPAENQAVEGRIQIAVTAIGVNLASFQVELASANTPTAFQRIVGPINQPVENAVVGEWDSTSVPNGTYILRLTMTASGGGGTASRQIQFVVNNPPPTPTPSPTWTLLPPLPTLDTFATPIPFNSFGAATNDPLIIAPTDTPSGFIPFGELMPIGPTPTIDFGS